MNALDIGGDERDRTADPLLARQVLSQLSYTPISVKCLSIIPLLLCGVNYLRPLLAKIFQILFERRLQKSRDMLQYEYIYGRLTQLGECLLDVEKVTGSSPVSSTNHNLKRTLLFGNSFRLFFMLTCI